MGIGAKHALSRNGVAYTAARTCGQWTSGPYRYRYRYRYSCTHTHTPYATVGTWWCYRCHSTDTRQRTRKAAQRLHCLASLGHASWLYGGTAVATLTFVTVTGLVNNAATGTSLGTLTVTPTPVTQTPRPRTLLRGLPVPFPLLVANAVDSCVILCATAAVPTRSRTIL